MLGSILANLRLSFKQNFLSALFAAIFTTLFSMIALSEAMVWYNYLALGFLHFLCAFLFLEFFWLPLTWCRQNGPLGRLFQSKIPNVIFILAFSLVLAGAISLIFPVNLLHMLFREVAPLEWRTELVVILLHGVFAVFFVVSLRSARFAGQAQGRNDIPVRSSLFLNGLGFIFGLYFVLILEWWMINLEHAVAVQMPFAALSPAEKMQALLKYNPDSFLNLPKLFQPFESISHDAIGFLLPLISVALSGAFLLFIGGIVPLRLMSNIVLAIHGREAIYCRRLRETSIYTGQFFRALIAQNPLFSISSLVVIIFLIVVPLLIVLGGNRNLLKALVGPDQVLFIFTLLAAWLSPLIYAGVHVDRTFGLYFNTKLANAILSMRGHLVVLGYGDLGQRVVRRELAKMLRREGPQRLSFFDRIPLLRKTVNPRKDFKQHNWLELAVSPELNIELLCLNVIIVDRNSDNFVFAATNDVLGSFGVVSAWEQPPAAANSRDRTRGDRILAPVVQGDATEPFTLARVNLERASFLISVVSQEARIREIFAHAAEIGLRTIICVSRSDQINNLTYKAARHPITLVYPKQHSGLALGQRLIAATLKIKARLPKERDYPAIMVVGLNKSNHFMLETLWHNWPEEDEHRKTEIFSNMLRFVVTDEPPRSATFETRAISTTLTEAQAPNAMPGAPSASWFNRSWHSSYITGFRNQHAVADSRPLHVTVPTCVMKMDESGVLERCLHEFRPELIVINDDDVSKSAMLLMRCVNTLSRLKFEREDFRFPLIMVSASADEEGEKRDIGDAFRYYDALTRLHGDFPGAEYPRHAHFRRAAPRRLVGDSIHDGLADAEEIIAGVRDNWLLSDAYQAQHRVSRPAANEIFELNTCLPNAAGALAELTARLAGLEFSYAASDAPEKLFMHKRPEAAPKIFRPSFQYLRHLRLEMPGRGFCLSGYADLQEDDWNTLLDEERMKNTALAARVYAKDDGRARLEQSQLAHESSIPQLVQLTTGVQPAHLDAKTFVEVMHGANRAEARTDYCPGMTICPIASYQHYIVASNGKILEAWQHRKENGALRDAPHYSCTKLAPPAPLRRETQNKFPRYARIFCCCHVKRNDPGMVALALNLLNFRRFERLHHRAEREQNLQNDWIVNLEYFKDTSCQNRRFSLNRLFGVRRYTQDLLKENGWTFADYEERCKKILPLTLIQIMPVGGPETARGWLEYGVALRRFLQSIAPPPRQFELQWWDQFTRRHEEIEHDNDLNYPIAIQINNRPNTERGPDASHCEYCDTEDADMVHRCALRRPWMEDDR